MLGLYFYHKFCFHSRFPFFPTFTFRNWLRDAYYYSGRHENYWVQILGRIYDMKIWTHFNSGVLKVSFPPVSVFVKVRIGEGAPCDFLFSLHIFTPIIYFWSFCWLPSFSIIFVSWHRCWRSKERQVSSLKKSERFGSLAGTWGEHW